MRSFAKEVAVVVAACTDDYACLLDGYVGCSVMLSLNYFYFCIGVYNNSLSRITSFNSSFLEINFLAFLAGVFVLYSSFSLVTGFTMF